MSTTPTSFFLVSANLEHHYDSKQTICFSQLPIQSFCHFVQDFRFCRYCKSPDCLYLNIKTFNQGYLSYLDYLLLLNNILLRLPSLPRLPLLPRSLYLDNLSYLFRLSYQLFERYLLPSLLIFSTHLSSKAQTRLLPKIRKEREQTPLKSVLSSEEQ